MSQKHSQSSSNAMAIVLTLTQSIGCMDDSHACFSLMDLYAHFFVVENKERWQQKVYMCSFYLCVLYAPPNHYCCHVRCRPRLGSTHAPVHKPSSSSSNSSRLEDRLEYIHNSMMCAMRFLEQAVRRVHHSQPYEPPHERRPDGPRDTFGAGETL